MQIYKIYTKLLSSKCLYFNCKDHDFFQAFFVECNLRIKTTEFYHMNNQYII